MRMARVSAGMVEENCFVSDGDRDLLNLGSIHMEPQIAIRNICAADTTNTFLNANGEPQRFTCSRTLAGWFPRQTNPHTTI
jgi:hypothetical protein